MNTLDHHSLNSQQDIIDYILHNSIPFGSRRWGGFTDKSDYDFVMDSDKAKELINYIEHKNKKIVINLHYYNNKFNILHNKFNFKLVIDHIQYDIIVYDNSDLQKIIDLNIYMDKIKNIVNTNVKYTRHYFVEKYLDFEFKDLL